MINEISDKRKLEGIRFGVDKFQELRDNADKETDPEKREDLESKAVQYGHKSNVKIDKMNTKQINKIKAQNNAKTLKKSEKSGDNE